MYCKMTRCDERVDAYSTTHYVIWYFVYEWVRHFRLGELHVRVSNRFERYVQQEFVVEKISATSVKCCHYVPVSVRSSLQFLCSRSPE